MIKTHTFCGRKYLIDLEGKPIDGRCDTFKKERELIIMRPLGTLAGFETVLHEALHASQWPASEERVTQTAKDIARFLWRVYDIKVKE